MLDEAELELLLSLDGAASLVVAVSYSFAEILRGEPIALVLGKTLPLNSERR